MLERSDSYFYQRGVYEEALMMVVVIKDGYALTDDIPFMSVSYSEEHFLLSEIIIAKNKALFDKEVLTLI